jgi:L-lactate dehydrogenase complex protein LldF
MPDPFHRQIRAALSDLALRSALEANAERRANARRQALATLPQEAGLLRRRAHAIRAQTIENLDFYLDQFIRKAVANGLVVHRAVDAREAIRIILEIAREHQAVLAAKSKSMLSEEIELNRALEQAGLRPLETDLGEFIVQLRGERPAHLISPAVHLGRAEVGQTFHERLGVPLTDDIPTLIETARQYLGQFFQEANLGITGVNFGVCETGSICLVTNEGNGRMVTTLPPVHIALMGIERIVPTMDDLALLLNLLARSATGQKLTVYTTLIQSPRRSGDPDGPVARHLILLDNGREALHRSPLAEALLCIRCGACLNACPVFRDIGGHAYVGKTGQATPYTGPIGSVLSPGLFGQQEFGGLARASTLCGACQEACPVDIDLPALLLRVRAGGLRLDSPRPGVPPGVALGLRAYTWLATSPRRFHLAQRLAGLLGRLVAPSSGWIRLPAMTGWGSCKDFSRPATRPFREVWASGNIDRVQPNSSTGKAVPLTVAGIYGQTPNAPAEAGSDLLERFGQELQAVGGILITCQEADLPGQIVAALRQRGISRLMAWEDEQLPAGLVGVVRTAGIDISYTPDDSIQAGLTGAIAGVAESGTILLVSGEGQPQTASLLPEIHLAVLRAERIVPDLAAALRLPETTVCQAAVLICGPSRTADIEMTLTIGVHGPRELLVFCYRSSSG